MMRWRRTTALQTRLNWAALSQGERDAAYDNNAAVKNSAALIAERNQASEALRARRLDHRRFDRAGIDPDLIVFDPDRVNPQRPARPAVGNLAIAEIERGCVPGAAQASSRQVSEIEVSLFVRAHSFAGDSTAFVPDQDQIDADHAGAHDRVRDQTAEAADRHPFSVA
jgi:hypothetical protein